MFGDWVCVYVCVCIYIYIEREREKERDSKVYSKVIIFKQVYLTLGGALMGTTATGQSGPESNYNVKRWLHIL